MKNNYTEAILVGLSYIVRVYKHGKMFEYEYGNAKRAVEHYNNELTADRVELLRYSLTTKTEKMLTSK